MYPKPRSRKIRTSYRRITPSDLVEEVARCSGWLQLGLQGWLWVRRRQPGPSASFGSSRCIQATSRRLPTRTSSATSGPGARSPHTRGRRSSAGRRKRDARQLRHRHHRQRGLRRPVVSGRETGHESGVHPVPPPLAGRPPPTSWTRWAVDRRAPHVVEGGRCPGAAPEARSTGLAHDQGTSTARAARQTYRSGGIPGTARPRSPPCPTGGTRAGRAACRSPWDQSWTIRPDSGSRDRRIDAQALFAEARERGVSAGRTPTTCLPSSKRRNDERRVAPRNRHRERGR